MEDRYLRTITDRFPKNEMETRCKVTGLCSLLLLFQLWLLSTNKDSSGILIITNLVIVSLLVKAIFDFRAQNRRDLIHKAVVNISDQDKLLQALLGTELAGWNVYDTVKELYEQFNTKFHVRTYQEYVKKSAKELSEELANLPPGDDYDSTFRFLNRFRKLKSWKKMAGEVDLSLPPTSPGGGPQSVKVD